MEDLPLNALRAFAAIYESGGVRPASRQLMLSPSAVHRQLRELERRIGVALIEPGGGAVHFTATGERLARAAQEALARLQMSVEAAREDRRTNDVVIATTESFARRWLIPRLVRFRAKQPRITVSLRVGRSLAQMPRDADLAIRIGVGPWPDEIAEPLMDEWVAPVAAPGWLTGVTGSEPNEVLIAALLDRPMVHDRDSQASWRRWAAAQGIDDPRIRSGARLPSSDLVLEAARVGLGAAMARLRLAQADLAAGNLITFKSLAVPVGASYWLIRQAQLRAAEQEVVDWLRNEASTTD